MKNQLQTFVEALSQIDQESERVSEKIVWEFVSCVRQEMNQQGVSRKELAERLNVSMGYVTQILNGSYSFTVRSLSKIAHALECDITVRLDSRKPAPVLLQVEGFRRVAKLSFHGEHHHLCGATLHTEHNSNGNIQQHDMHYSECS